MVESPFAPILPKGPQSTPTDSTVRRFRMESRKFLRFRIDEASANLSCKGYLYSLGLGKANKARAAIDLSEGGVLLLTCEPIPVGTKVRVRIETEAGRDFLEAAAEVRWSKESQTGHYTGVEFSGLGDAEIRKIARMREEIASGRPEAPPSI